VTSLNIGGLERVVLDLVRRADRDRFEMRVLCLGASGQLAPDFSAAGVAVEFLGLQGRGTLRSACRVAKRLRALRVKVLHTHNPAPHLVGALAAAMAGVPTVIHTKHGRNYPEVRSKVIANQLASLLTNEIVAVSEDARQVAEVIERVPRRKLRVIRNGIDIRTTVLAQPGNQSGAARAVHVARLIYPTKDQDTLLRAVRIVADSEPSFILDIVGDGPHRSDLEALAVQLDLGRHVIFHGFRRDIGRFMSEAQLFVLSSVTEGLSLTLLEAMAAGLPVVATDVGGNREVVADGRTGHLVPAKSPNELAAAMLRLIRDPALSSAMGRAGRQRAEEFFSLDGVVRAYEALYTRLSDNGLPQTSSNSVASTPLGCRFGIEGKETA
jgi:glycosyltransferase involved in cell wall biosynthesis